jgi:hypothetical protein
MFLPLYDICLNVVVWLRKYKPNYVKRQFG